MIQISVPRAIIPESLVPKMTKGVIKGILADVATGARAKWVNLGSNDSSVFRFDYIQGIQPVVSEGTKQRISLVGEVPHILEDGSPRIDMRDTLLGPNVPVAPFGRKGKRLGKNHEYYRAIPFRHTSVGSGKTIGQAMGSAYAGHDAVKDARKLGQAVYRAAKKLEGTTTTPYGKTAWGGRLDTSRIRGGLRKGQNEIPLLKPHHKSDIYKGMIRQRKTYEKARQTQYTTFRTISTGVRDESWWRKAIRARKYAEQVQKYVQKVLPLAFNQFIEGQK